MTPPLLSMLLGVLGLTLHVLIIIVVVRLLPERAPVLIHFASAIVVEIGLIAAFLVMSQEIPFWHGSIVLGWGVIFLLFAFSAVYKSVSLTMLVLLNKTPEKCIGITQFSDALIQPVFADRIRVLEKMDYITETNGTYNITTAGEQFVTRFGVVRRIFGISGDGFYRA